MFETLSMLVHADSKVGKSTLGGSAPKPMLIIDAEGSTKFLPLRRVQWDPLRYAPPVPDGTWDAAVVSVRSINDAQKAYEWLLTGQHGFRSVDVDSISEIQRKLKSTLVGLTEEMRFKLWDQLLRHMDYILRGIRDLQDHPTNPIPVTIFISETKTNNNGKQVPNMQGQMGTMLPYLFDLVGYYQLLHLSGQDGMPLLDPATGLPQIGRRLHIVQGPQWEAGERVQGRLGQFIDVPLIDPTRQRSTIVEDIYYHLFPHMRPQTQQGAQQV